jgi:predicted dehydrogenase
MSHQFSRRDFLQAALAAGTAIPFANLPTFARAAEAPKRKSPNEKLNFACIGVGGRGHDNVMGVASENIAVLCDIDEARLAKASSEFPKAKTYADYRRVFDHTDLDGVVVATPDHMHAIPIAEALRRKLPVYSEKPLTHSVYEIRYLLDLCKEAKVATQTGNQIHDHESGNYRRVVEAIKGGVIGPVRRVHIWLPPMVKACKRVEKSEVPKGIDYDLWVGPAPYRPFHPTSFHFDWRFWWDFGGGQLSDFICHYMDLPYWALDLKYPKTVHATGQKGHDGDNDVPAIMQVEYEFEARGDQPPVHITWYQGGIKPEGAEKYDKTAAVLFEGDEGKLLADYTTRKVFMANGKEARTVAPSIPDSVGHHEEWIRAIRTGHPTTCPFEYGGLLTECGHLGNVSYRAGQKKIEWDAANMKIPNLPEAEQFLKREYRKGWKLEA